MSLLWENVIKPLAFRMDAERAHELGIKALESGLASPFYTDEVQPILHCERFGLKFKSPLGVAAGFDKNGVVVEPLARLGFGFVEVGTVTARPQPGNQKPRLFRLPSDRALVNRLGFNNEGAVLIAERLRPLAHPCVVGVNIGRNKDVRNDAAIANYLEAFEAVYPVADYIAVNVSSPNTPGLRELQGGSYLGDLISALQEKNDELAHGAAGSKPLLVKIAPDLGADDLDPIIDIALEHRLSGVIATNTTISRDGLKSDSACFGEGGLSGAPLRARSTRLIRELFRKSSGRLPIIGVGGIFSAEDAFEKIAAGASLVQAYTGFVYRGPAFAATVNRGLAGLLRSRGFGCIDEAVGCEMRG